MSDKEKYIALSKIIESIKRFERNIEQYKKSIYNEANERTDFIAKRPEEVVNEDVKKYLYYMIEKKKIERSED